MNATQIQSYIESVEKNSLLYEEKNFKKRAEVLDFISFQIIDAIDKLSLASDHADKQILLKYHIEKIISELNEIDNNLFQRLRAKIRTRDFPGKEFKNLIAQYFDFNSSYKNQSNEAGYDNFDILINGLITNQPIPEQTKNLEPEMVYYQKTPAKIVFEFVKQSHFTKEDIFFDLGSGLGQLAILVNLLTGIKAKGVEFEPSFCEYARNCAMDLNLTNVGFLNVDARKADYSEGTIFYLFTPFKGRMLEEVLDLLKNEALQRKIKIITYGPCTAEVALQNWLTAEGLKDHNLYRPCVFTSF